MYPYTIFPHLPRDQSFSIWSCVIPRCLDDNDDGNGIYSPHSGATMTPNHTAVSLLRSRTARYTGFIERNQAQITLMYLSR